MNHCSSFLSNLVPDIVYRKIVATFFWYLVMFKLNFKHSRCPSILGPATDQKRSKSTFQRCIVRRTYWNTKRPEATRMIKKWSKTAHNKQETAWNALKRATTRKKRPKTTWDNLKQHTTSKKRPETIWNELQRAWNDLKRPSKSKKQHEATNNNLKRSRTSKKQPTTTFNEQILNSWTPLLEK